MKISPLLMCKYGYSYLPISNNTPAPIASKPGTHIGMDNPAAINVSPYSIKNAHSRIFPIVASCNYYTPAYNLGLLGISLLLF